MKRTFYTFLFSILCIALAYPSKKVAINPLETALLNYDMSTITHILQYDPMISIYPSTNQPITNDQVTVYVHGWGESQKSIPFFKANSSLLNETVIGFNFKDARLDSAKMPKMAETNFCQTDDIASLLMTLKVLDDCNVPVFHLFGSSRGGGTIITTIARLTRYKQHKAFFNRLQISKQQITRILEKIKAGTIVLNCPLVDINLSLKDKLIPYGAGWLSSLITYSIIPCITNYSPIKDHPIKAAKHVQKLNIPILVHFQKDNLILGNKADAQFYQAIQGPHTYLVLGDNGGHFHRGETLAPALHAFRKKHNGPYINNAEFLNVGEKTLACAPDCTTDIKKHIDDFYAQSSYVFNPKQDIIWQQKYAQYDMNKTASTLGYDPIMRVYQADTRVDGTSTTVYVHGYGDNYKFTVSHFQLNSYLLPGSVASFNFQDVTEGAFKLKIDKSSVGQSADIASLATILKTLDECGLDIIHLFGYSRGGATVVTTLGRLCDYKKHTDFFTNLDINETQAKRIVNKIRAGTIILNCPLVDSRAVAQYWFGRLDNMVMNTIVPKIMEHHPDQDQAIDAAKVIQPMNFKILVHFQKNDTILGNTQIDATFYNNLKGPNTYLVIADEGGHMHTGKTLNSAVQAFRKKYNGAYYPIKKLVEEGNILLQKSPQSDIAVKNYVAQMYI